VAVLLRREVGLAHATRRDGGRDENGDENGEVCEDAGAGVGALGTAVGTDEGREGRIVLGVAQTALGAVEYAAAGAWIAA
jgi:hypothetical protein